MATSSDLQKDLLPIHPPDGEKDDRCVGERPQQRHEGSVESQAFEPIHEPTFDGPTLASHWNGKEVANGTVDHVGGDGIGTEDLRDIDPTRPAFDVQHPDQRAQRHAGQASGVHHKRTAPEVFVEGKEPVPDQTHRHCKESAQQQREALIASLLLRYQHVSCHHAQDSGGNRGKGAQETFRVPRPLIQSARYERSIEPGFQVDTGLEVRRNEGIADLRQASDCHRAMCADDFPVYQGARITSSIGTGTHAMISQ